MIVKVRKKAETNEKLILMIGVIIAFTILFSWFIRSFVYGRNDIDLTRRDLNKLQYKLNKACGSAEYYSKFNPLISYGNLSISNYSVCINTEIVSQCRNIICNLNKSKVIYLKNITYVNIAKVANFINFTTE